MVARKLQLKDFETWSRHELEGYPNSAALPPYRQVRGEVRGWNPYHGWVPVFFESPEHTEKLSVRTTAQPIPEIDDMLQPTKEAAQIVMPFEERVQQIIREATGEVTSFATIIPTSVFARIIEAVRTTILNWNLELEAQGVRA